MILVMRLTFLTLCRIYEDKIAQNHIVSFKLYKLKFDHHFDNRFFPQSAFRTRSI